MWQASNGDGYMVVGNTFYYISPTWALTSIGSVSAGLNTPISMTDNGIQAIVVQGVRYAGNAAGTVHFTVLPTAGDTVTLNGVLWTFVSGTPVGNQIQIVGTCAFTIAALVTDLNGSVDPALVVAEYSLGNGATPPDDAYLQIVYKLPGAIGTAYTLAASAATRSAATLRYGTVFPGLGWVFTLGSLAGNALTLIVDPAWTGADRVDFLDTFIVWNQPGTRQFGSTLSNQILPLDATYIAGKTAWPDPLQSIIVCQEQILLPGALKSEMWYDSGGTTFPFARLPGVSQEHGIVAKYSLASADLDIFWLSADLQGKGQVLRMRGNSLQRISNYALEYQLSLMSDITDAIGYCFLQAGHLFYVLSFPTGNQTWVWDASVGDPELGWHQRAWTDLDGTLNRDRGVLGAQLYGKNVVIDWENGTLYEQSATTYTDTLQTAAAGSREYPITYLRTFPHLVTGTDAKTGQQTLANGQMVQHNRFAIDVECGTVEGQAAPLFQLRWSDDRGKTWGNPVQLLAGRQGEYGTRPDVQGLGMAMDRVYELSWTFPGKVALNGAWVEGKVMGQ